MLETVPPSPKDTSTAFTRLGSAIPSPIGNPLETSQRNWETGVQFQEKAKTELSRAEQALKSGDVEGYKKHLGVASTLHQQALDTWSNEAYRADRARAFDIKHPIASLPGSLPTYGNYGGKGWTGGWAGKDDGDRKLPRPALGAINKMDEAFQRHDEAYGRAKTPEATIKADQQLVADLRAIRSPSDLLGKDGRGRTYYETVDEDMRYRDGAIKVFEVKIAAAKADLMRTRTLQGIENGTEKIGDWAKAKIKGLLDILPN